MNNYSSITFRDKNPVKRWLQYRRIASALNLATKNQSKEVGTILDFGAGNGELIKLASDRYSNAQFFCYEPNPSLAEEAKSNLVSIQNVSFCGSLNDINNCRFDLIFCLEVFEHLPEVQAKRALQDIDSHLELSGTAIFGVPVEIGIPALYKGLFRKGRRKNTFDTDLKHIFNSLIGLPPQQRPSSEIAPGMSYYFEHMGFDYRGFETDLKERFKIISRSFSPWNFRGLMPEVYYVAQRRRR